MSGIGKAIHNLKPNIDITQQKRKWTIDDEELPIRVERG